MGSAHIRVTAARLIEGEHLRGVVTILAGPVRIAGASVVWSEGAQMLLMPRTAQRRTSIHFADRRDYDAATAAAIAALDALEGRHPVEDGDAHAGA